MTEDEMAGWNHWLDTHGFEQTPGVGDGQGGLECCDSWSRKESDTTERLNWTELNICSTLSLWYWKREWMTYSSECLFFHLELRTLLSKTWSIMCHLCKRSKFPLTYSNQVRKNRECLERWKIMEGSCQRSKWWQTTFQ